MEPNECNVFTVLTIPALTLFSSMVGVPFLQLLPTTLTAIVPTHFEAVRGFPNHPSRAITHPEDIMITSGTSISYQRIRLGDLGATSSFKLSDNTPASILMPK